MIAIDMDIPDCCEKCRFMVAFPLKDTGVCMATTGATTHRHDEGRIAACPLIQITDKRIERIINKTEVIHGD